MTGGERGWGALPYIPSFFFFFRCAAAFFRALIVRAREYLLPLSGGMRGADLIRDEKGLIT